MTQIISCITHDYVVQISDRRLVYVDNDGSVNIGDDDANKAVLFCNRASICYAGLAKLDGKRTDYWLVNAINNEQTLSGTCDKIIQTATAAFKKPDISRIKDHEKQQIFVATGWTFSPKSPQDLRPIIAAVSNFDPNQKSRELKGEFILNFKILSNRERYFLFVAGQPLSNRQMIDLDRQIRVCVRKNTGPSSVALMIVNAMRKCSKDNVSVGHNLMVNSIPRTAITNDNQEWRITSSIPNKNSSTFFYHTGNNTVVKYGPHFVCNGSAVVDFESGSLN